MNFNKHFDLAGRHAFLSASKYHWLRYDDEKLAHVFETAMAAQRGSELHALAADLIRLGVKLPATRATLNAYVNDALGFHMTPEQVLYVSENCFGTADAISFRRNKLRIHDLKTGVNVASMDQLKIYAAMFCLEYLCKPFELSEIELRIYQNDEIVAEVADPDEITHIMSKIRHFDQIVSAKKEEALS